MAVNPKAAERPRYQAANAAQISVVSKNNSFPFEHTVYKTGNMGFAYFAKNGNTHHLIRLIPIELSLSQREYVLECMVHTGTSTQVLPSN